MTIDQLTDFYALTAKCDREAQKQADCFLVQAMNLAIGSDALVAMEMLLEASRVITDTLERDMQRKQAAREMESLNASLDSVCVRWGGLYD